VLAAVGLVGHVDHHQVGTLGAQRRADVAAGLSAASVVAGLPQVGDG
jgi:hypothetical protein